MHDQIKKGLVFLLFRLMDISPLDLAIALNWGNPEIAKLLPDKGANVGEAYILRM